MSLYSLIYYKMKHFFLIFSDEKNMTDKFIHDRDMDWLQECDGRYYFLNLVHWSSQFIFFPDKTIPLQTKLRKGMGVYIGIAVRLSVYLYTL